MAFDDQLLEEIDPTVMSAFIVYCTLLVLKIIFVSLLTSYNRIRLSIFSNPEDNAFKPKGMNASSSTHPMVERVRRMHMNDLENIIPFIILALLFAMTSRDHQRIIWHFRIFFGSRVLHSICHYFALQPFRTIFYTVALIVNLSMGGHILCQAGLFTRFM